MESKKRTKIAVIAGALSIICLIVTASLASSFLNSGHRQDIAAKIQNGDLDAEVAASISEEYTDSGAGFGAFSNLGPSFLGGGNLGEDNLLGRGNSREGNFAEGNSSEGNSGEGNFSGGLESLFGGLGSVFKGIESSNDDFSDRDGVADIYKATTNPDIFKIFNGEHYVAYGLGILSVLFALFAIWQVAVVAFKRYKSKMLYKLDPEIVALILVLGAFIAVITVWLVKAPIAVGGVLAVVALVGGLLSLKKDASATEEATPSIGSPNRLKDN